MGGGADAVAAAAAGAWGVVFINCFREICDAGGKVGMAAGEQGATLVGAPGPAPPAAHSRLWATVIASIAVILLSVLNGIMCKRKRHERGGERRASEAESMAEAEAAAGAQDLVDKTTARSPAVTQARPPAWPNGLGGGDGGSGDDNSSGSGGRGGGSEGDSPHARHSGFGGGGGDDSPNGYSGGRGGDSEGESPIGSGSGSGGSGGDSPNGCGGGGGGSGGSGGSRGDGPIRRSGRGGGSDSDSPIGNGGRGGGSGGIIPNGSGIGGGGGSRGGSPRGSSSGRRANTTANTDPDPQPVCKLARAKPGHGIPKSRKEPPWKVTETQLELMQPMLQKMYAERKIPSIEAREEIAVDLSKEEGSPVITAYPRL